MRTMVTSKHLVRDKVCDTNEYEDIYMLSVKPNRRYLEHYTFTHNFQHVAALALRES
jgi:hypothetical protein